MIQIWVFRATDFFAVFGRYFAPLDPGHWMDPHILKDPDPGSQNNVDQRIRIIDFNAIFNIAILLYFLLLSHDHNFLNFKPKPSSLVMFYICIQ